MYIAKTMPVKAWLAETKQPCPGAYMPFQVLQTFRPPPPPKSLNPCPDEAFQALSPPNPPDPFVAIIENGRICGEQGAIFTPDHILLEDVSDPRTLRKFDAQTPVAFTADTAAALTFPFGNNYFHWMLDVLPRIRLLRNSGITIDSYIISPQGNYPYLESLELLNIPIGKVLHTSNQFYLQAAKLIVTPTVSSKQFYPKWAFDFVRDELMGKNGNKQPSKEYDRIYISRSRAGKRNVLNEPEVVRLLERYGFQCIHLEDMSLFEQIHAFQSASVIVAPHGAGLTNLLFSRRGVKIIELFPPNYVKTYFSLLGQYIDADYYYLIGIEYRPPESVIPNNRHDDLLVSGVELVRLLNIAGVH